MSDVPSIDTPFGPIRIHITDQMPDGVELVAYAPPPAGAEPGDPDWIPLEKRVAMVTSRPEEQP